MSKLRGVNTFQLDWLEDQRFKDWIIKESSSKVKCRWCKTTIDVTNMGVSSLTSHASYKKHKQKKSESKNSKTSSLFFKKLTTPLIEDRGTSTKNNTVASSSKTLDESLISFNVLHAEIKWCLKVVKSNFSFRSCDRINNLFIDMFSDSVIAKKIQLGRTKCAYFVNFGIAPHVKSLLIKEIKLSPFYSLSFDESMNRVLQSEQMDIQIRHWDSSTAIAKTRYYDSQFVLRPNAENLFESIKAGIKDLPDQKFIQLSMDGPSTNWAILRKLTDYRQKTEVPPVEDIGSCSLHVVAGSLQTAFKETDWSIDKILKAMWQLFHDSPARRETYIRVTGCNIFPKQFCQTRWTENVDVVSKGMDVWENVVKTIKEFLSLAKSKRPKNKSYKVLVDNHNDKTVPIKFQLFKDIGLILQSFLKVFQTDQPMIPFLSDVLENMIRRLMKMFIQSDIVNDATTPRQLMKNIDCSKKENQLVVEKVRF